MTIGCSISFVYPLLLESDYQGWTLHVHRLTYQRTPLLTNLAKIIASLGGHATEVSVGHGVEEERMQRRAINTLNFDERGIGGFEKANHANACSSGDKGECVLLDVGELASHAICYDDVVPRSGLIICRGINVADEELNVIDTVSGSTGSDGNALRDVSGLLDVLIDSAASTVSPLKWKKNVLLRKKKSSSIGWPTKRKNDPCCLGPFKKPKGGGLP